jgi:hypothetical protein
MNFADDSGEAQLRAIQVFLADHQNAEELDAKGLIAQLRCLRETGLSPLSCQNTLEMLFACLNLHLKTQVERFVGSRIPLDRGLRQKVRILQGLLDNLAAAYEWSLEALPEDASPHRLFPLLERISFCLQQHLYISYLVAAPVQQGVWRRLHRVYQRSLQAPLESSGRAPRLIAYREALLLAAGQPASHTSKELVFITDCIAQLADWVMLTTEPPADGSAVFWIEPPRDFALFALSRRVPPPGYPVFYFSCARVAAQIQQYLEALEAGRSAHDLRLPALAETPTGRGALRRLAAAWGAPGKRRFSRRRQANHQRATLCAGLNRFHQLLQHAQHAQQEDSSDFSQWMIINESPDGYALMHLSGAAKHVGIGNVVALRTEAMPHWLVCLVRWAISENPEHIEIGLQIIALNAIPGTLTDRAASPVLLLPIHPPTRVLPALLMASGNVTGTQCALRLEDDAPLRECKGLKVIEQNGRVELLTFET